MTIHVVVPFGPEPDVMQAGCTDCGEVSGKMSLDQADVWAADHERDTGHLRCTK